MVQKFVYLPQQQAQFEQLEAEVDRLWREMMALKQQQTLNAETGRLVSPPKSLVFSQAQG
jgi:cell division protein FtsB